jgi:uncharacterized membrane protein YgcG
MRKNTYRLFFVFIAGAVLLTSPVFADLGLAAKLAAQPQGGARAVGEAVLDAANKIYAGSTDRNIIQPQLVSILNEAAATGNESAIRHAIVAVMLAGGVKNLSVSKEAINASDIFANYPALLAVTVASAETLLKASAGASGDKSGGDKSGGDKSGGDKSGGDKSGGENQWGGGDRDLGGGDPDWFEFWNSFPSDNDVPATRI